MHYDSYLLHFNTHTHTDKPTDTQTQSRAKHWAWFLRCNTRWPCLSGVTASLITWPPCPYSDSSRSFVKFTICVPHCCLFFFQLHLTIQTELLPYCSEILLISTALWTIDSALHRTIFIPSPSASLLSLAHWSDCHHWHSDYRSFRATFGLFSNTRPFS